MMRRFEAPSERAASTNSFSRSDSTWPRMMRAMYVQLTSAITKITVPHAGLDSAAEAAVAERAGRGEADAQQQDREGEQHVDQAREHRVDPAAVVAGDHARP